MGKAIVLGGYGLIGSACIGALQRAGFQVVGIGRSAAAAKTANSEIEWILKDIPSIPPDEWLALLGDADVVVNASGALQDGSHDSLTGIHEIAISNIMAACADLPIRFIQISAAGVSPNASTEFFRSKARGDAIISERACNWVILRPTLVLSSDAYGGTALLRAVASLPWIQPSFLSKAQFQTVHVDDVASAVVAAALGEIASGTIADLTEAKTRTFPELVDAIRQWQGWAPAVFHPALPEKLVSLAGRGADVLGFLGWRSPLRTTAINALRDGIAGNPETWAQAGGAPCRPLAQTLASLPSTRQERLFARFYLALPLAIATLSLFWLLSGLVALLDVPGAMAILTDNSTSSAAARILVVGGAFADVLLGLAILWRPWARLAALGMVGVSTAYLLGSLFLAPALWADPLGPMVKVFPGITLACFVWLLMEDR